MRLCSKEGAFFLDDIDRPLPDPLKAPNLIRILSIVLDYLSDDSI